MAEAFGVIAGVIGVIGAALKAGEVCSSLINTLSNAPRVIRKTKEEIDTAQAILDALQEHVRRRAPYLLGDESCAALLSCLNTIAVAYIDTCHSFRSRLIEGRLTWQKRLRLALRTTEFSRFHKDLTRLKTDSTWAISILNSVETTRGFEATISAMSHIKKIDDVNDNYPPSCSSSSSDDDDIEKPSYEKRKNDARSPSRSQVPPRKGQNSGFLNISITNVRNNGGVHVGGVGESVVDMYRDHGRIDVKIDSINSEGQDVRSLYGTFDKAQIEALGGGPPKKTSRTIEIERVAPVRNNQAERQRPRDIVIPTTAERVSKERIVLERSNIEYTSNSNKFGPHSTTAEGFYHKSEAAAFARLQHEKETRLKRSPLPSSEKRTYYIPANNA